jgi:polar amino acid transport system substrate-binding protein
MKTIKLTIFLIALLLSYSILGAEKDRKTLVLAGDYWCPYNCYPQGPNQGYLVELIRRALDIYNIDVVYKMLPWHEILAKIDSGAIDGVIGISNINNKELVTTRLPLEYSTVVAFTRSDTDWIYDGVSSLKGKKVGLVVEYRLDESLNNYWGTYYVKNPGGFALEDDENAVIDSIGNLIGGHSDVYFEDQRVVEAYISKTGLTPYIRNAGKVSDNKVPIYVAFSNKIHNINEYINYLEEGIASLKATGEYDDLRQKYHMDDL